MTSNAQTGTGEDGVVANAGSSTEQHVTGAEETGSFTEEEEPTGNTPAHGSSNAGINAVGGNRRGFTDDAIGGQNVSD